MDSQQAKNGRSGSESSGDGKGQGGEVKKCFVKLVVIGDSGVGKSSLIHFF